MDMAKLIDSGKAPAGAVPPLPIPRENLFSLDVDDPIWDDTGLDDTTDGPSVPQWLGNENVRAGIKAILTVERCDEEFLRLKSECQALHRWIREEWDLLAKACHTIGELQQIQRILL